MFGFVEGPPGALLLLRVSGSQIAALNARCTHQLCIVRPAADGRLHCPCHGSQFEPSGALIPADQGGPIGPATFPLQRFAATLSGTTVVIDLANPQ